MLLFALTALFTLSGVWLCSGGAALLLSGGSPYYLIAGCALLACALGLWRRSGVAMLIYSGLLIVTLLWSAWEVGLDGWQLAPRLMAPGIIGLVFMSRAVTPLESSSRWWIGAPVLVTFTIVATAFALQADINLEPKTAAPSPVAAAPAEWPNWGNTLGGTRYAPVSQIDAHNVHDLKLAWQFESHRPTQAIPSFEATPLAVDGRLYVCLQPGIVAALDQDTGKELWRYTMPDFQKIDFGKLWGGKCRGVSYYESAHALPECPKRILFTRPDGFLMAVDAATGLPCPSFGKDGAADMRLGMGEWPAVAITSMPSSPPAIVKGIAVIGQSVTDLGSLDAPSGVIRGYDAETGELRWAWDAARPDRTLLQPGETYTRDTPNAWGVLSGDQDLGLVFVPTGNSLPDYFGGMRWNFAESVSSAIVAIDVATGKVRWTFQTVHHDLWDYDVGAQPVAVDIPGPDGVIPAILVPTKLGDIFVLDRRNGRPIDPVIEKPVPQDGVPEEHVAKTQPATTGFPSLSGPALRERDMWGLTPLDQLWCRVRFLRAKYEGPFTPVGTQDTLFYPGTAGGIDWGSVSIDTQRGLVAVNALRFSNFGRLVARKDAPSGEGGGGGWVTFQMTGTPYIFAETPFMSPLQVPCQAPPYGTMSVLDLKTRKLLWTKPLGSAKNSGPFGIPSKLPIRMGVPNMGGSVVTAGGLVFIAATQDRMLRAFDISNGHELWSAQLPAVAAATPMSFVSRKTGRQYVVVASGGHYGISGPPAGTVLAFALPPQFEDSRGGH
jgi:quinoprotein glucose dehydrogenase